MLESVGEGLEGGKAPILGDRELEAGPNFGGGDRRTVLQVLYAFNLAANWTQHGDLSTRSRVARTRVR